MVGATPALAEASSAAGKTGSGLRTAKLPALLAASRSFVGFALTLERTGLVLLQPCLAFDFAAPQASFLLSHTCSNEALLPIICH